MNITTDGINGISSETENQIKGSAYEKQILELIRIDKPAYVWHKAPETILIENGIIGSHNLARLRRKEDRANPEDNTLQDTGIDIIMMDTETECSLIQCKNGYKRGVTMHDLGGFMCWMAMMTDKLGYVYYTDKLSLNIRTLPTQTRIKFVQVPFDISYLGPNVTQIMPEFGLAQAPQFTADPAKLEYQIKARDQAVEYYRTHDNGVLSMPCGTGKTYTTFLIAQNFKNIIILSPLKQFAKQNLDRFIEYGFPPENVMLVDSDGCRDVTRIQEFITEPIDTGFLLSATYDSADVISSVLSAIPNPAQTLIICDEFHNLSANNVNEETDPMNKIITASGFKKLFMSATPRIFELEEEGETGDYVLGQTFFDMSFKYAIDKGFITDYRVWLPSVHEDLTDLRADICRELDIKDVLGGENIIYSKAIYLFSCLVNTGVQKCIIYCVDTAEIRELMACMAKLNAYYCLDLHMDMITSANSTMSRANILDAFASSSRIELLFSVRILDECIDIPSCDSIYITYPTKSKIRTIQRIMRCTRTVRDNKYKVGHVFIWCAEYDSILETLGGIKEIDISFADKVKINAVGQFQTRGQSVSTGVINDCTEIKKLVIGVKEYRFVSWHEKLDMVKQYIDANKKRPGIRDKDPIIKTLGVWCSTQVVNYSKKVYIMANPAIYSAWTEFINHPRYSVYFLDNITNWNNTFDELKKYIDENGKRPSDKDKDTKIKTLSGWCSAQVKNYSKKAYIMADQTIYSAWTEFINHPRYSVYFIDNDVVWHNNLIELKKYIGENGKRPSTIDKTDPKIKTLGRWCSHQVNNYSKKVQIMADPKISEAWHKFITSEEYKDYFKG